MKQRRKGPDSQIKAGRKQRKAGDVDEMWKMEADAK